MSDTTIEWTGRTWNPITGCTKVSPGCKNCYAERMANRLQAMGQRNYKNGFELTLQPHMLALPLRWKKPQTIFVNSMSDLFHERVSDDYIAAVFGVMGACPQHTFQVLTKRAERLPEWFEWLHSGYGYRWEINEAVRRFVPGRADVAIFPTQNHGMVPDRPWPLPNVWIGVSVEDRKYGLPRIDHLRRTPAAVRFLSIEPLLEDPGELDLDSIDWVIVGCESGPGARHAPLEWVRSVREQVMAARKHCGICWGVGYMLSSGTPAHITCSACSGRGWTGPALFVKQWDVCESCDGLGKLHDTRRPGDNQLWTPDRAVMCRECKGTGQTGRVRKDCPAIDGRVYAEYPVPH